MDPEIKLIYESIDDNIDLDKLLHVDYWKLGIVLDLDCQRSKIIFDQVILSRNFIKKKKKFKSSKI